MAQNTALIKPNRRMYIHRPPSSSFSSSSLNTMYRILVSVIVYGGCCWIVLAGATLAHAQNTPMAVAPEVMSALKSSMTPDAGAQITEVIKSNVDVFKNPVGALSDTNTQTTIQANEMLGQNTLGVQFLGDVEITKPNLVIRSGHAFMDQSTGEVSVFSQVEVDRADVLLKADRLQLNVDQGIGQVENAAYQFGKRENNVFVGSTVGGKSTLITFDPDAPVILKDATFTTCRNIDAPDWYLKTSTLELDQISDQGNAYFPRIYFKGVPFLALPYVSFPLTGARKSGVLPPSIEYSSTSGLEWRLPIYWNIAPNRDATFTPNLSASRGLKLDTTARYLEPYVNGTFNYDTIYDLTLGKERYLYSTDHFIDSRSGVKAEIHLAGASDNNYLTDFSRTAITSSQRLLPRSFFLQYQDSPSWQASVRLNSYQLLQDSAAIVARPYDRLPQVSLSGNTSIGLGLEWSGGLEYTRFWQPDTAFVTDYNKITGVEWKPQFADRTVLTGAVSLPIRKQGYFFDPKYSYHATLYEISRGISLARSNFASLSSDPNTETRTRGLGTLSIDSGLVFERPLTLGGVATLQTLEPRLFYVQTPFVEQADLPNFDSALTEFNFAQMFTSNVYSGSDRIADANQLTTALTTRLLNADSGQERSRFTVAQRAYFSPRILENTNQGRSDILLSGSGFVTPALKLSADAQYNVDNGRVFKSTLAVNWNPEAKKIVNLSRRRFSDTATTPITFDQYELSSQWPLSAVMRGLYGVGQASYSVISNSVAQQIVGLEYHADCWVLRFVTQKFNPNTTQTTTNYFLQLEFTGWSRVGINPLDVLRSNITNYK